MKYSKLKKIETEKDFPFAVCILLYCIFLSRGERENFEVEWKQKESSQKNKFVINWVTCKCDR